MNEHLPKGQRPAGEEEIREVEIKLGKYSSTERDTDDYLGERTTRPPYVQTHWHQPTLVFNLTHVRLVGGAGHEHISEFRWRTPANEIGHDTLASMVDRIRNGADVRVTVGGREVKVGVVDVDPPYIRAHAERLVHVGTGLRAYVGRLRHWNPEVPTFWTDDLLTLPRF